MRRSVQFDWVDAFTDRPFTGNGCAVLHDAADLDAETCMAVVRETSLVECTFTEPSNVADFRIRYFLASREIPFAGHPTLATAVALRQRNLIVDGPCTFETGAGIIHLDVDGTRVTMQQVPPRFGAEVPASIVARVFGLDEDAIVGTPQIVSTGLPFCVTRLTSKQALASAALKAGGLRDYFDHLGTTDTDLMEPFLCVIEDGESHARLLLAPPSPPEDPFTGSATGAMASYLWALGHLEAPRFTAHQGGNLGRPGRADVEVIGARDDIQGVKLTGHGYVLLTGEMRV